MIKFIFFWGVVLIASVSFAQDSAIVKNRSDSTNSLNYPHTFYWLSLGLGASGTINDIAPAFGALFSLNYNFNIFTARVINSQGVQDISLPHEKTFDVGILY